MTKMKRALAAGVATAAAVTAIGCYQNPDMRFGGGGGGAGSVSAMVATWPDTAKQAATAMIEKYGQPQEATPHRLVWHGNGPFQRTIVLREEIPHHFPMKHEDVLEQAVKYRVPPEKFDELAAYDGSVIVERTRGEMSARCDKEGANLLALNLAHDIITNRRTVEDARRMYAQSIAAMMKGEKPRYMQALIFPQQRNTNFTDQPHNMLGLLGP